MPVTLSPTERAELATALAEEVGAAKLQGFVVGWLGRSIDLIAPGAAMEDAPRLLLDWVVANDETGRLVNGIMLEVPRTPKIRAFLKGYLGIVETVAAADAGLVDDPPPDPTPPPAAGGLQAAADLNNVQMAGMARTATVMNIRSRQICKVVIDDQPSGTGVLIAPDRVLTAHHVVKKLLNAGQPKAASAERLACVFDNYEIHGKDIANKGVTVGVVTDWLGPSSEPHPKDGVEVDLQGHPPDAAERLDFAVLKLAQPIGNAPLSDRGGAARGWLDLAAGPGAELAGGSTLHICQHPQGFPLQVADGQLHSHDSQKARVRYRIDTLNASSGSPCFDVNYELVAVHNASLPTKGRLNQGVPIAKIRPRLSEGTPKPAPAAFTAVWRLTNGAPVLGRTDVQQQAWSIDAPASAKRIFVVKGGPKSGRTFSIEIVRALLAGRQDVFLDRDMESLHDKPPEDFLVGVAKDLLLPITDVPQRPTDRQSSRWASTRLIEWFVKHYAARYPASPSSTSVWIALDNYDRAKFKDEDSLELLVQLMRATPGLETLRFLLVGDAPDANAVPASLVVEETLQPLGAPEVGAYLRAVRTAANKTTPDLLVDAFAQMAVSNATGEVKADTPFVLALQRRALAFGAGLP